MNVTRSTRVGSQTGVMLWRFATPTSAQTAQTGSDRAAVSPVPATAKISVASKKPVRLPTRAATRCHNGITTSAGPTNEANRIVVSAWSPNTYRAK